MPSRLLAIVAILAFSGVCTAASITCTWTGNGGNSNWSTAANWSNCSGGAAYPGQTYPADSISAVINAGGPVNLDVSTTIGGNSIPTPLTVASGRTLNLATSGGVGTTLTVVQAGGVFNSGTINISATSGSSSLALAGPNSPTIFMNQGTIVLGNNGSIVENSAGSIRFVNNGTISGSGALGNGTDLVFLNNATINANSAGNTLVIDPMGTKTGATGFTNVITLQAGVASGSPATLRLLDGNFANQQSGMVNANANGIVWLDNSNLSNDGRIVVASGGELRLSDSSITNSSIGRLTVNSGGTVNAAAGSNAIGGPAQVPAINAGLITATNGAALTLSTPQLNNAGGTIKPNGGTIILSNGTFTDGAFDATASQIQLNGATIQKSNTGSLTILTGPSGGIVNTGGASAMKVSDDANPASLVFHNLGTIDAQAGTLTLNAATGTGANAVVNEGILKASGSGTLVLNNSWRSVGTLQADAGGTVVLHAANINGQFGTSGGTITVNPGGTLEVSPGATYVVNTALLQNGTFHVDSGSTFLPWSSGGTNYTQGAGGQTIVDGTLKPYATGGLTINGGAITVNSGGSLSANASPTLTGTFTTNSTVSVASGGTISAANYQQTGGSLAVAGTVNVTSGFTQQAGNVTINSGGTLTDGTYTHTGGTLDVESGAILYSMTSYNQTGGTATIDGTLQAGSDGAGTISVAGGSMNGAGTLMGNVIVGAGAMLSGTPKVQGSLANNGTLSIGNSPGIMNVTGDYTQTGTWVVDLFGDAPGTGYDQLNVTGNVMLAGILDLNLGYTPTQDTTFIILTYLGSLNGSWSSIDFDWNGKWNLIDDRAGKTISVQVAGPATVPEPASLALIGLGLCALCFFARRKK